MPHKTLENTYILERQQNMEARKKVKPDVEPYSRRLEDRNKW
ncbi:MAG: hypothetical protein R2883_00915 [Caldisericia bacterium]